MELISLLMAAVLAASILNRYRYTQSQGRNKLALVGSLLLLSLLIQYRSAEPWAAHAVDVLAILIASYTFSWQGGVASALLLSLGRAGFTGEISWVVLFDYSFLGAGAGLVACYFQKKLAQYRYWQLQLHIQAKKVPILQDISLALQQTTDLATLLHIMLTAITAGYALGFNRAMLFLVVDDQGTMKGEVGIGSMNEAEGFGKWNTVNEQQMTLSDFISLKDEVEVLDHQLNDWLRQTRFTAEHQDSILYRSLRERKPFIIRRLDPHDPGQRELQAIFKMDSFAVVPLLNQDREVGIIIVDNNINHKPISADRVHTIIPLAAQASVAIENARLYEQTLQMSVTDGLTGLFNQRYFHKTIHLLASEASSNGQPLSVILMDLDSFKHFNDTNGHLEGNRLLIQLSGILRKTADRTHIPCRFGGEEFAVILPAVPLEEAAAVAERIRAAVEEAPFYNREAQPQGRVTLSLGVAVSLPGGLLDVEGLIEAADTALYEAKRSGKNRVVCFTEAAAKEGEPG